MNTVIYSASPLQAFSGGIFLIAFLFLLGLIGAGWAAFNRRERVISRVGTGCAAVILLLAGIGMSVVFVRTIQTGDKTVSVQVNKRREVVSNCDTSGGTCTSYLLETKAGQKLYDFTVPYPAYEKVETNNCYSITYYPSQSLFGNLLQQQDYSDSYEAASTITRIEKTNCQ